MIRTSPMGRYLAGFRLHCVAEGRSPRTVQWYEHKLRIFGEYLQRQYGIDEVTAITADHIRAFLVYMREKVHVGDFNPYRPSEDRLLSPQTVQGYYRAIRAFFSWLVREEHLEKDPSRHIRRPKAPQTIVATLDENQIRRLLAAPDRNTSVGFRDYCILLLFLDTGIRLGELVRLKVSDLHLETGYIQVRGKGDKERLVPIGNRVRQVIWRYLARHRPEPRCPEVENVFLMADGRPMKGEAVYRMVVRRGKQVGISGVRCSPHTLRHTFAVHFLRNGGDPFSLQRILGHTSLAVTRMYCNLNEGDIQVQHRRYGPVDRLLQG